MQCTCRYRVPQKFGNKVFNKIFTGELLFFVKFNCVLILEKNACRNPHSIVEALKRTLKREWAKLPMDVVRAAIESVPKS